MISLPAQRLQTPIAVICHDAGATNLIVGWLRDVPTEMLRLHAQGPAASIWGSAFPDVSNIGLDDALQSAAVLLSGTAWASSLEHEARVQARDVGIPSIAAIDHWVNYRERFIRDGRELLPDEIWVSDDYALKEASICFPQTRLRQFPNFYLRDQVDAIRALDLTRLGGGPERVLYALEPIRLAWQGTDSRPGEFQALDYLLERLSALSLGPDTQIRLRPHPSDPLGKYDAWVKERSRKYDVAMAPPQSLAEALSWADWVVGCESFVLVIGLAAGKRTVSSLPPWGNSCRLPHRQLIHLSRLP